MQEDISKWKDTPLLWIGSFNIVKMSLLSKAIYIFNTVAINILMTFHRNKKLILKLIWNLKGPCITKKKILKKNKARGTILPDFKVHYKATVIRVVLAQSQT